MATETTDLTIEILRRMQADIAEHRRETRQLQQSFVDVARLIQRMDSRFTDLERRIGDQKSDLETMFKMELIGQHAHQQTKIEQLVHEEFADVRERLDRIEAKLAD